jgi:hypothetical protein
MAINWQDIIAGFVATVGGGAVVLAAAAWLIKTLVSNRLVRDAEKFKIEIKASADTEIERVKASLARASRVHERQLDILQNLYRYLCEAQGLFQRMTSAGRVKDELTPEAYGDLVTKAMESAFNELVQGRLLIPSALAQQCDSFFNTVLKGRLNFYIAQDPMTAPVTRAEFWKAAATVAHQEVPKILLQIEEAARAVVHGEPPKNI